MQLKTVAIAAATTALLATPSGTVAQSHDRDIALAIMPLPEAHRADATVLGYEGDGMVTLRDGTGDFICLTDRPGDQRYQVACYHRSLAAYMARGRELRAEGVTGQSSIEARWEEIGAGTLEMPQHPAALYELFGDPATVEPGVYEGMRRLTVVYISGATEEDTGLSSVPAPGVPWIMFPGTPTAHIMISQ